MDVSGAEKAQRLSRQGAALRNRRDLAGRCVLDVTKLHSRSCSLVSALRGAEPGRKPKISGTDSMHFGSGTLRLGTAMVSRKHHRSLQASKPNSQIQDSTINKIRTKNRGKKTSQPIPPHLGSLNGSPPCRSPTTHPGAYSLPVLIRCPSSPLPSKPSHPAPTPATTTFGAPLILAGLAECTLAVSEYISLVTLAALRIVPARLMLGLAGIGPLPLRLELGERETAV
jgi:hypothetical protein